MKCLGVKSKPLALTDDTGIDGLTFSLNLGFICISFLYIYVAGLI